MPRVRVPLPPRLGAPIPYPVKQSGGSGGILGLLGGLAGLLLCLLCLATMGLLGLFAAFIAVTAYLGWIYRALRTAGNGSSVNYMNMAILLAALCFAGYHKLRRSL
ncbi:unnamed protein product [Rotaria sordida]|uniref:Uncharacterized protein n=1 Tax=Rotaria sordida TaxID=392033 RepID=A0A814FE71_9BILA|nr:unnamed protein product [Rotaria sordida]CAF3567085.1 unnamed protein product [Rotaria sordida]